MTKCNMPLIQFPRSIGRGVEGEFSGGESTSDAGVLLLCQVDRRLGLLKHISDVLPDPRDSSKIVHDALSLLRSVSMVSAFVTRICSTISICAAISAAGGGRA